MKSNAQSQGLSHLVEAIKQSMLDLDGERDSIDLIWAEGSIYCAGFDTALKHWLPLLKPGGCVACTELSWLSSNPSQEAVKFWNAAYPQARSIDQNIDSARTIGFKHLGHFTLPESAWWDEYYTPLQANIDRLQKEADTDPILSQALNESVAEIDLYKKHSSDYGYVFYLFQKADIS